MTTVMKSAVQRGIESTSISRWSSWGARYRAKRVQVVDLSGGTPTFEDVLVYNLPGLGNPVDIAEGPDGSLYLSDIFQGRIFRIQYTGP